MLSPGTTFADRYLLTQQLGAGGFSQVWLAQDAITELTIAIKIYAPVMGMDESGLKIFAKELANVYNLNHANLLKPQHVDTCDGKPYLIMSYCPNGSLKKQIGHLTEQQAWQIIREVSAGLAYLHEKNIIHQDIKPDNILIDDAGHYLITDFGISTKARSTLRKSTINAGAVSAGTLEYMAPERFGTTPLPVKASDIWSLGAMMFELLTGEVPFIDHGGLIQKSGADIPLITGNYSDELKNIVYSMLAPQPWDRPTAEQLAASNQQSAANGQQTVVSHQTKATVPINSGQRPSVNSQQPTANGQRPDFSPWVKALQIFYMVSYGVVGLWLAFLLIDEIVRWDFSINSYQPTFIAAFIYCFVAITAEVLMFLHKPIGLKMYWISSVIMAFCALWLLWFFNYLLLLLFVGCAFIPPFINLAGLFIKRDGISGYQVLGIQNAKPFTIALWSLFSLGFACLMGLLIRLFVTG